MHLSLEKVSASGNPISPINNSTMGNESLLPKFLIICQCHNFVRCPYIRLLVLRSQLHSPEQQNGLPTPVHTIYPTQYGCWTRIRNSKWSALKTTLQGILDLWSSKKFNELKYWDATTCFNSFWAFLNSLEVFMKMLALYINCESNVFLSFSTKSCTFCVAMRCGY